MSTEAFPTAAQFESLVGQTFLEHVAVVDETASTNDDALAQIRRGLDYPTPGLIVARRQTAGRGRGDHRWHSSQGALTFSLVLGESDVPLPVHRWPLLSLATGIALRSAVAPLVSPQLARLKWPNDLYVGERKAGGILVEVPNANSGAVKQRGYVVVGIGLNVNNRFDEAPTEVRERAVSLREASPNPTQPLDMVQILARFLEALPATWASQEFRADRPRVDVLWNPHCFLTGRPVRVSAAAVDVRGIARGVDFDGALLVENEGFMQRCSAGEVHWTCQDR